MSTRRHAREWALQLLFQLDMNPSDNLDATLEDFWQQQWRLRLDDAEESGQPLPEVEAGDSQPHSATDRVAPPQVRAFMERLVRGVRSNLDDIDGRIASYAENWPLHRMGGVDRNVLRLAIFEMFYDDQAPPVVCINEAVDLAKFFSSSDSGKFVNGILDRACKDVKRPARVVPPAGRRR